jgi:hypothetical protein
MADWPYLCLEIFKLRQVIAAYWLKDCEEIVEIGGYKVPMSEFVTQKITVIDPLVEARSDDRVTHLPITFQNWSGSVPNNFGLVILGFDLIMELDHWKRLYGMINTCKAAVIETPIDYEPSIKQFSVLLNNTNKKISQQVLLDLSGNEITTKFVRRRMHLLV